MATQHNNGADETLKRVAKSTQQVAKIIRRLTRTLNGMREEDALRITQALIKSRVAYSQPFYILNKNHLNKIDASIRTAYKAALGLPIYTANHKLYDLGVCKTFEEIRDALLANQKERLLKTRSGRAILSNIGSPAVKELINRTAELAQNQRKGIKALPIPKHMDKTVNKER